MQLSEHGRDNRHLPVKMSEGMNDGNHESRTGRKSAGISECGSPAIYRAGDDTGLWRRLGKYSVKAFPEDHPGRGEKGQWDTQKILLVMWDQWNTVFNKTLGHPERSIVSELRETRKNWAHQQTFSGNDTYRALDSVERLLTAGIRSTSCRC